MTELVLRPALPWTWMLPVAAAALAAAAVSYRFIYKPVPARLRATLVALRLLAVATVLGCMAGPVWSRTEKIVERGSAIIALDVSRSMNISDSGGPARIEAAAAALAGNSGLVDELADETDLRTLVFSSHAEEADISLAGGAPPVQADGAATDISALLDEISRLGGVDCAGAVVISDGRDTAGGDVLREAARLGKMGLAVFAVGVGEERTPEDFLDLRVDSLVCLEKAFVRNRMTVKAKLATVLPEAHDVKVTFSVDGEVVGDPVTIRRGAGRRTVELSFDYLPTSLGVHRAEIAASPLEGERNVQNNVVRAFFRVFGSRLAVLYVEGSLRWDFKYLRRAVAGAPNVDFAAVEVFRKGEAVLPRTEREWQALKVLILGDVPASRLDARALARVPKFVMDGGALLVMAGRDSLGPGGYGKTALARILPVTFGADDGPVEGPLDVRLTADGLRHPVCRVADDPETSRALWEGLPELLGVFSVGGVKPAASTLLTAGPKRPLLAVQDYGAGRTAVFLAEESWRWVFAEKSFPELHKRFWRQLIANLAHNDYGERGKVLVVETDRMRYLRGERATVSAWVGGPGGPLAADFKGAKVVATVTLPGGQKREMELGAGPGEHSVQLQPRLPGDYHVAARLVTALGKELGADETRFSVVEMDLEDENPAADLALLAKVSRLSGGQFFPLERLNEALKMVKSRNVRTEKTVERVEAAWNGPWAAAIFMGLVCLEWAIRKRRGLA